MSIPIFVADAFTARAFSGNPAGVCILPSYRETDWMLRIAREMKHSETAFIVPRGAQFEIRWFTPEVEVPLCGHATLASAHVLWEQGFAPTEKEIRFACRSGVLRAQQAHDWIEMDFPAQPVQPWSPPPELQEALGAKPQYVGRNKSFVLVMLDNERAVRELKPSFTKLRTIETFAVVVTALADMAGYDFVSRTFAPRLGIDEDPATGSAHCCLGPFWQFRTQKSQFMAYQASARSGVLRVRVSDDRVIIGGQAVTVLKGELAE